MLRALPKAIARLLWSALSSIMRLGLHFVSADSQERVAVQRLRQEFEQISVAEPDDQTRKAKGSWPSNRLSLRKQVLSRDPRAFLTWGVIRETMFPPPYAPFTRIELSFLKRYGWGVWRDAIRERMNGLPLPNCFYSFSSSNAIHQAYHLSRFEVETHLRVGEFGTILEFGGGYGCLCRIAHGIGFCRKYLIVDLPEQSALQRYYLAGVGIKDVRTVSQIEHLASLEETFFTPKLFIATWSLSEIPLEQRQQIAEAVRSFDAFLIAYQSEFEGLDNELFFARWQTWFPDVSWTKSNIAHLPGSCYLFGVRQCEGGVARVLQTGS